MVKESQRVLYFYEKPSKVLTYVYDRPSLLTDTHKRDLGGVGSTQQ